MAKANFTYALKRFFPGIEETEVDPGSVKEVLAQLENSYPGLSGYIVDDQGQLRQHVNGFVNGIARLINTPSLLTKLGDQGILDARQKFDPVKNAQDY